MKGGAKLVNLDIGAHASTISNLRRLCVQFATLLPLYSTWLDEVNANFISLRKRLYRLYDELGADWLMPATSRDKKVEKWAESCNFSIHKCLTGAPN